MCMPVHVVCGIWRVVVHSQGCGPQAAECEARHMGAFLAVARGSETDPLFIHMTYRPKVGPVQVRVS